MTYWSYVYDEYFYPRRTQSLPKDPDFIDFYGP